MVVMSRRPLIAGNWKMNGLRRSVAELEKIVAGSADLAKADILVCPPATLVLTFAAVALRSKVKIGGQVPCRRDGGVYGDISAEMLADAGRRRSSSGIGARESCIKGDAQVRAKVLWPGVQG
jgi:triosephosphate isomerase